MRYEKKPSDQLVPDVPKVIHPFYVFQVASIALWSLDNYYYYAFCIALISIISITTTLLETKKVRQLFFILYGSISSLAQTIKRMREMSRLSCKVDVYRNGTCKSLLPAAMLF